MKDRSIPLDRVDVSLSQQIQLLKSMAASPGLKTEEAQQAEDLNIFKTVVLEQTNVRHDCAINQGLYLNTLAGSLE